MTDPIDEALAPLRIPPPRPPRAKKTAEEAMDLYPALDDNARDPFLTAAEQESERTGRAIREDIVVAEKKGPVRRDATGPIFAEPEPERGPVVVRLRAGFLEGYAGGVDSIFIDRKSGKKTALIQSRAFAVGDATGDFVIASIDEGGMNLRAKNGSETRRISFKKVGVELWGTQPRKPAAPDPWKVHK